MGGNSVAQGCRLRGNFCHIGWSNISELLKSIITAVAGHINSTILIDGNFENISELTIAAPFAPPLTQELAIAIKQYARALARKWKSSVWWKSRGCQLNECLPNWTLHLAPSKAGMHTTRQTERTAWWTGVRRCASTGTVFRT